MSRSNRSGQQVRYVQIVQVPAAKSGTAVAELNRSVVREAKGAEPLIATTLQKLANLTSRRVLDVTLSSEDLFTDESDIAALLRQFAKAQRDARPKLRACIFVNAAKDRGPGTHLLRNRRSHLVGIHVVEQNARWRAGSGATSVIANISLDYCRYLLHDIAVDIAMFHSWPKLRGLPLLERIAFSRDKARFAASTGASTLYGTPLHDSFGYFSLASLCWNDGDFDVRKYIKLWDDLMTGPFGSPYILRTPPPPTFVDQLLSGNRLHGQVDGTTLERKLRSLGPGEYALVTSTRRPKLTKTRAKLAGLFSKRVWHRNMSDIIPSAAADRFTPYRDYVEIYRFVVPGNDGV